MFFLNKICISKCYNCFYSKSSTIEMQFLFPKCNLQTRQTPHTAAWIPCGHFSAVGKQKLPPKTEQDWSGPWTGNQWAVGKASPTLLQQHQSPKSSPCPSIPTAGTLPMHDLRSVSWLESCSFLKNQFFQLFLRQVIQLHIKLEGCFSYRLNNTKKKIALMSLCC